MKNVLLYLFIFAFRSKLIAFVSGSELVKSIKITTDDHKPKFKKSVWTQNPESPNAFEENELGTNDNDQNYSTLSNEVDM